LEETNTQLEIRIFFARKNFRNFLHPFFDGSLGDVQVSADVRRRVVILVVQEKFIFISGGVNVGGAKEELGVGVTGVVVSVDNDGG
jgi:hypothetical protein